MWEVSELERGKLLVIDGPCERLPDEELVGVQDVWITPESAEFRLHEPVNVAQVRRLYLKNCSQPFCEVLLPTALEQLNSLVVAKNSGALAGVRALGNIPTLKMLLLRDLVLDDEITDWVVSQARVKMLALSGTNVADKTVGRLACREVLSSLEVFRTEVSFSDRSLYEGIFPRLRSLDVSHTNVTSAAVGVIKELFPALERLFAEETTLSDRDLQELAQMDKMKVFVSGSPEIDFDRHQQTFWDYS